MSFKLLEVKTQHDSLLVFKKMHNDSLKQSREESHR